jgi:FkbM family methyltransferase
MRTGISMSEIKTRSIHEDGFVRDIVNNNQYCLRNDLAGASVIDVGANIGCFALACAARGASPIYCLEADPETAALCVENLESAGVQAMVGAVAVWGGEVPEVLSCRRFMSSHSGSGSAAFGEDGDDSWKVPAADFDEIVMDAYHENHIPITIVKLDCEGAESTD